MKGVFVGMVWVRVWRELLEEEELFSFVFVVFLLCCGDFCVLVGGVCVCVVSCLWMSEFV